MSAKYAAESAWLRGEKDDALCPRSETGLHFLLMAYDAAGRLIPIERFPKCQCCGCDIEQRGHRWVARPIHVITEETYIEDLL